MKEEKMEQEKMVAKFEFDNCCEEWEYEDNKEAFIMYLEELIQAYGEDYYFFVEGHNLGWRNRSGYFIADTAKECYTKLAEDLRTEWRMVIEVHTDRIEITRYHHDSPTGEFITIMIEERK